MRYKSVSRFPDSLFFGSNPYLIILSFSFESFPLGKQLKFQHRLIPDRINS